MFKTSVEVTDPGLITAYAQLLENAPEVVNTRVNATVNRIRDQLLQRFREEPDAVAYPVQWTSDRQRKAYFATNGFGHGIPYSRSHDLVNAWKLVVVYQANRLTEIALSNDDPARQFVTGWRQQRFHAVTGWYKDADLLDQADAELTDAIETDLIQSFYAIDEAL
jgi:hypothetical protein